MSFRLGAIEGWIWSLDFSAARTATTRRLSLVGVLLLLGVPGAARAAGNAYVANHVSSSVSEYGIGPGDLLSPLAPPMVPSGVGPFGVTVSPDGRSAYVTNTNESTVSQYNIDATTGVLGAKIPASVASGQNPEGIAITPDGRSAYVTNAGPSNDSRSTTSIRTRARCRRRTRPPSPPASRHPTLP